MKRRSQVTVITKPLGQYRTKDGKIWRQPIGMYFPQEDLIVLDPRQNQRSTLNTTIHEMLHRECPGWTETKVKVTANRLAAVVWSQGYRKEY